MENHGDLLHSQLVSIVEVLANAAVLEICKLVDEGFSRLRLEVSRTQRENLELRDQLRRMEAGAPVPPPSRSEEGCRAESLLGNQDGETDLLEEKPLVVIKAEQMELTGCIMGERHPELPATGIERPSLAPKEELVGLLVSEGFRFGGEQQQEEDQQAWSGGGLVGGPSTREGGDFQLGGSPTLAPGCGIANGARPLATARRKRPGEESKSSKTGAPRRLSSRLLLLSPRPDDRGAEDCPGSSLKLSFQSKKLSSSVTRDHPTSPSDGRGLDPPPPWVFSCPLCMKDFSTSRGLMVHQSIRHQPGVCQRTLRPFSCNLCGKCFLRSGSVKPHMGIHTGEQPYACTQCGRRFSARGNLVRHRTLCTATSN